MNTPIHNQFDKCIVTCWILLIYLHCVRFLNTVIYQCVAKQSKAPSWKARGCWFDSGWRRIHVYFHVEFFDCFSSSSVKPIQIKLSMAFFRSNSCIKLDIILKTWRWFMRVQISFMFSTLPKFRLFIMTQLHTKY